jgi:hypothetical protein
MRKLLFILLSSLLLVPAAGACPWCRPKVQAGIYTPAYSTNMLLVLLPVAVLLAVGVAVYYWDKLRPTATTAYAAR